MQANHLAANLRMLCGHYRSVAEVCRLIGINRQQFNKYLSATSQPSLRSLRRICDFFGVDETEIFLTPDELSRIVRLRADARTIPVPLAGAIQRILSRHADSQPRLARYCGDYAGFIRSPAFPGMILRNVTAIFQHAGHTYAKTIERVHPPRGRGSFISKYMGLVLHGEDKIYVLDCNAFTHQGLYLTILYPSHRSRLHLLSGIGLSVSSGPARQAFASRYVLEHLGSAADRRAAIRACGLYPNDSEQIGEAIGPRLRNEISAEEGTLCAPRY